MPSSHHTQITPAGLLRTLHSGEHNNRGLPNEGSISLQNSSISSDFPVFTTVLQLLLKLSGISSTVRSSATSEWQAEKEEKLRYSEEMLQQGMKKFGMNSSNEDENFLILNHESDITEKK